MMRVYNRGGEFFEKGYPVNILGFTGHTVSVASTQHLIRSAKAVIDDM